MPELPDVEYAKRYVDKTAKNQTIQKSEFHSAKKLLKDLSSQKVSRELKGRKIKSAFRHGKHLFIELDSGHDLVLHLGMTGSLKFEDDRGAAPEHARLIMHLDKRKRLDFINQRLLGEINISEDREAYLKNKGLGPDALGLSQKRFLEIFKKQRGSLKSALMNQKHMAGLGNIYTDETLFQAGYSPEADCKTLEESDWKSVRKTMQKVLKTAIKAAPNFDRLPKGWLLPNREEGRPCPKCAGKIKKKQVSGRSTYYCPSCQNKGKA